MKKSQHSITVLIPAKNSESTIRRAIDSVLAQSLLPDKIVVVNDSSSDNTLDILKSYHQRNPGMFTIVEGPGLGAGASRQAGLDVIETRYVAFLDSDDWYSTNALKILAQYINETGAVSGAICKVYADGVRRIQKMPGTNRITYEMTKKGIYTSMSSSMYEGSLLKAIGGFDKSLVRMEDLDFHLKITRRRNYYFIPQVVAYYSVPSEEGAQFKAYTYAKWEAIVWKRHGFFRWDAFFHATKNFLVSILFVPLNLVRKFRGKNTKLFNDLYPRMLLGYLVGMGSRGKTSN